MVFLLKLSATFPLLSVSRSDCFSSLSLLSWELEDGSSFLLSLVSSSQIDDGIVSPKPGAFSFFRAKINWTKNNKKRARKSETTGMQPDATAPTECSELSQKGATETGSFPATSYTNRKGVKKKDSLQEIKISQDSRCGGKKDAKDDDVKVHDIKLHQKRENHGSGKWENCTDSSSWCRTRVN